MGENPSYILLLLEYRGKPNYLLPLLGYGGKTKQSSVVARIR
jgi:hypothetical protein